MSSTFTQRQLLALPSVVDLPTAASALGLGRSAAYELVRLGQWPTPVLRLGRVIRVPTAPLLALLGVGPSVDEATVAQ
jgi:predicted DNA-binding transcriptional regulator AlpA